MSSIVRVDTALVSDFENRPLQRLFPQLVRWIPRSLHCFFSPPCIDLSGVRVRDFIGAFTEIFKYNFQCVSNCIERPLKHVKFIGLADMHGMADINRCNTLLARLLHYPNHATLFCENSEDHAKYMINTNELEDVDYKVWDDVSFLKEDFDDGLGSLDSVKSLGIEMCCLIQRLVYVAKRDLQFLFHKKNAKKDSFDSIQKTVSALIRAKQKEIQALLKIVKHTNKKAYHNFYKFNKRIMKVIEKGSVANPKTILNCIILLNYLFTNQANLLVKTTFKVRQKFLNRILSAGSGGILLAGQNHLVKESFEKGSHSVDVESSLKKSLEATNYLFICNIEKVGKFRMRAGVLENHVESRSLELANYDFSINEKRLLLFSDLCILVPRRIRAARWLLDAFYDAHGRKKER